MHSLSVTDWIWMGLFIILLINAFASQHHHSHALAHEHSHHHHEHDGEHCHCHDHSEESECPADAEDVIIYKVDDMHCNHCSANVEKAIRGIPGVETVDIDRIKGIAYVRGKHDYEALIKAVSDIGYPTRKA